VGRGWSFWYRLQRYFESLSQFSICDRWPQSPLSSLRTSTGIFEGPDAEDLRYINRKWAAPLNGRSGKPYTAGVPTPIILKNQISNLDHQFIREISGSDW
jgi:hypothetical protein